jgi:hypothetical protein
MNTCDRCGSRGPDVAVIVVFRPTPNDARRRGFEFRTRRCEGCREFLPGDQVRPVREVVTA